jgi:hypothetical protein
MVSMALQKTAHLSCFSKSKKVVHVKMVAGAGEDSNGSNTWKDKGFYQTYKMR